MINTIKTKLIAIGSLLLAILTLGGYARYQRHRANKFALKDKQKTQVIKDAKQRQKDVADAYKLDADDINNRLREDYRD